MTSEVAEQVELTESELMESGLEKLGEALEYLDACDSFAGKNLAALVYVALRYGEVVKDEELEDANENN